MHKPDVCDMNDLKVGLIGCGNMGGAILKGMLAKGIVSAENVRICDKDISKAKKMAVETGAVHALLDELVLNSDHIIIAVKPQDAEELFGGISKYLKAQTVISIMAGKTIGVLGKLASTDVPIARAMPNMAATLGYSITGIAFNRSVKDKDVINRIFSSIGDVVEVEEGELDAVTAVSGSGPAYFFYIAKAMIDAGVKIGLKKDISEKLVRDTLMGAALIVKHSPGKSIDEMIRTVASKGGTTEAAISVFDRQEHAKVSDHIAMGLQAAEKRSKELSKG